LIQSREGISACAWFAMGEFSPTTRNGDCEEIANTSTAYGGDGGTEVIGGVLLLSNRYVPLALTLLGPVIVNILSFHMFLDSENMTPAIVVTVLWFVVFSQVRSSFAGLVAKKARVKSSDRAEALGAA
jgi:hypothetical protein